ncbi:hypothetical protein QZH46_10770 [Pseudomonas corrugata]
MNYGYRGDGELIYQLSYSVKDGVSRLTQANYFGDVGMLDAAGNQKSYRYVVYNSTGDTVGFVNVYKKTYALFDSYKETFNEVSSTQPSTPGVTAISYTGRGMVSGSTQASFAWNKDGQITIRGTEKAAQSYIYYQGGALVSVGNAGAPEIMDTFTPISSEYPSRTASSYIVAEGDTLERIAQTVWGTRVCGT